jgi:hypothetical protein
MYIDMLVQHYEGMLDKSCKRSISTILKEIFIDLIGFNNKVANASIENNAILTSVENALKVF